MYYTVPARIDICLRIGSYFTKLDNLKGPHIVYTNSCDMKHVRCAQLQSSNPSCQAFHSPIAGLRVVPMPEASPTASDVVDVGDGIDVEIYCRTSTRYK